MLKKMVMPVESIAVEGESEDTDDTDIVPDISSIGDIDESTNILGPSVPSPPHNRSYG